MSTTIHGDKNEVNEVMDKDTHSYVRMSKNVNKRDKPKSEKMVADSHKTLIPHRHVGDTIQYKNEV